MYLSRRTSRRLLHLVLGITLVGLLLAPGARLNRSRVKVPGTVAHAVDSKSYVDFINAAYLGAYNRYPDCSSELEPEFYNMVYYASQSQLQDECERFVSTLFETQASYNAQDLTTYTQTSEYESINAHNSQAEEAYVTDLYQAFLQREPDSEGLAFWTADVIEEGRKKGIVAFDACGEFEDLVELLYQGDAPSCGCFLSCGANEYPNYDLCECIPCPPSGGGFGQLCQAQ